MPIFLVFFYSFYVFWLKKLDVRLWKKLVHLNEAFLYMYCWLGFYMFHFLLFFAHSKKKQMEFPGRYNWMHASFFSSSNGCFCFSSFPTLRVLVLNFGRKTGGRLLQGKAFFEVPIGVKETFLCKFDIFTLICKSAIEIFLLSFPFWTFFWLITKRY